MTNLVFQFSGCLRLLCCLLGAKIFVLKLFVFMTFTADANLKLTAMNQSLSVNNVSLALGVVCWNYFDAIQYVDKLCVHSCKSHGVQNPNMSSKLCLRSEESNRYLWM